MIACWHIHHQLGLCPSTVKSWAHEQGPGLLLQGRKLSQLSRMWTWAFWHLSFVWRLSKCRWGLERGRDRNGVFQTMQGHSGGSNRTVIMRILWCGASVRSRRYYHSCWPDSLSLVIFLFTLPQCSEPWAHSGLHCGCTSWRGAPYTHSLSSFWPGGHCFSNLCLWKSRSFFSEDEPHSSEGF